MKRALSLAALLVCTAARCETTPRSADRCSAPPAGHAIAFVEGQEPRIEMHATVERIAEKQPAFVYELMNADGSRQRLNYRGPAAIPGLREGASYDFVVEYVGGFPPASAIAIRDDAGVLFVAATDQKPRDHVLKEGIDGFEIAMIDAGCPSRLHDRCYDAIVNQKLRVARGGQSAELMNGQSALVDGYRVRVLTAQRVSYNKACADAGLDGISFTIAREK